MYKPKQDSKQYKLITMNKGRKKLDISLPKFKLADTQLSRAYMILKIKSIPRQKKKIQTSFLET